MNKNYTTTELKHTLYNAYQLNWMIEHGYSLFDFVQSLDEYIEDNDINSVQDLYNDWEHEYGFNNSLYASYSEFCDNELLDDEYMKNIVETSVELQDAWNILHSMKRESLTQIMELLGYTPIYNGTPNEHIYYDDCQNALTFYSLLDLQEWIEEQMNVVSDDLCEQIEDMLNT